VIVPGFLALRWFYWRALPRRQTDLELVLYGLIASLPLFWLASLILPPVPSPVPDQSPDETRTVLLAMALGVLLAEVAARVWRLASAKWPTLRTRMSSAVWNDVLTRPEGGWFQVYTADNAIYTGWIQSVADTADTDEPDLYLCEPESVGKDGTPKPMSGVEGILIPRSGIVAIARFAAPGSAVAGDEAADPDA
jgi:hypothetical protein